ncbi:hypothetical protein KC19_9G004100 [Ceratodon purpureus]|uniref:Uncharacterized protein n=1 Tax=Ceratodon purpureus TaxID=3225 RepID=A0A8T0GR40_CERPU|nr:hypothetical protein KC19_9G004100 [Ceratodon purpureus]
MRLFGNIILNCNVHAFQLETTIWSWNQAATQFGITFELYRIGRYMGFLKDARWGIRLVRMSSMDEYGTVFYQTLGGKSFKINHTNMYVSSLGPLSEHLRDIKPTGVSFS